MRIVNMIEEELTGFGLGLIQDTLNLLRTIEEKGITLEDLKLYVEEKRKEALKEMKVPIVIPAQFLRHCPSCGAPMLLLPVKEKKGPANKHGYRSLWQCIGESCTYEEYNKKNVQAVVEEVRNAPR